MTVTALIFDPVAIADVFRRAGLDHGTPETVVVGARTVAVYGGTRGGCYTVSQYGTTHLAVHWSRGVPSRSGPHGSTVFIEAASTAARAAGLILDHQENLLP